MANKVQAVNMILLAAVQACMSWGLYCKHRELKQNQDGSNSRFVLSLISFQTLEILALLQVSLFGAMFLGCQLV
jgi:hypothetical protein